MRGHFVVFEGNDGSGKATQSKLLVEYLHDKGVLAKRFDYPSYDQHQIGALIGEILTGKRGDFARLDPKIVSALFAFDRFESLGEIRAVLEQDGVVVADRFTSSNQVHQGGKVRDEHERIELIEWIDRLEHEILGLPRPDVVFYLHTSLETSLKLLGEKRGAKNQDLKDGERDTVEQDRVYLSNSHETARWLAAREKHWCTVECEREGAVRSVAAIHEEITGIMDELRAARAARYT